MSRFMFRFWLDSSKQDENELIAEVNELKQNRSFAKTIRDGIRLVTSLSNGSMDVLFELFPLVRAEFLEYVESLQINSEQGEKKTLAAQNEILQKRVIELESENATLRERNIGLQAVLAEDDEHIAELEAENDKLRNQSDTVQPVPDNSKLEAKIDRLESLLINNGYRQEQPTDSAQSPNTGTNSGAIGLKGLSGGNVGAGLKGGGLGNNIKIAAPVFDDDDLPELTITKSKNAGTNANQNLINGLLGLQNS